MQRKRGRGRRSGGNSNNNNNNPNRHYESTGPDVKIRGSAQQILDKYLQYARDSLTAGDRVRAEAHFQHAEHYARIVAGFQKDKPQRSRNDDNSDNSDNDEDDNTSDAKSDDNSKSGDDNRDTSNKDDNRSEKKPRGRPRKSRNDDDPMRVIGEEDDKGSSGDEDSSSDNEAAEKPRRRTYRKKAEAPSETDGVMSTLSRGRSSGSDDETEKAEKATTSEAAE